MPASATLFHQKTPCSRVCAPRVATRPGRGGASGANIVDKRESNIGLESELCELLATSLQNGDLLCTQTLLAVGARLDWLSRKDLVLLSGSMRKKRSVREKCLKLLSVPFRDRVRFRIRRRHFPSEANEIAYRFSKNGIPDPKWLSLAALTGHPKAQHDLGVLFETGSGVRKNATVAFGWYERAAESGDSFAQNNFGVCYAKGIGTSFDGKCAVRWYRKSAVQDCPEGLENYSFCLLCGRCVKRDASTAFRLAKRAFQIGGSGKAAFLLSCCLSHGWGTGKHPKNAASYKRIATERGYVWAASGWKGCRPGQLPRQTSDS